MKRSQKTLFLLIAVVLLTCIFIALLTNLDLSPYLIWLIAVNLIIFAFYGYDKFMAINKRGRVPEIVLHLLALAGGFAGGWAGMFIFRHKINNILFIALLLFSTVLHCYLLFYIFNSNV